MRALAVLLFLLGIVMLLKPGITIQKDANVSMAAMNFAVYRNAVFRYVYAHRDHRGSVPQDALSLPANWRPVRDWKARVENGLCAVYGPASHQEVDAVRVLFDQSYAIGMAIGGHLLPQLGNPISVPSFVPERSLVSLTEVE